MPHVHTPTRSLRPLLSTLLPLALLKGPQDGAADTGAPLTDQAADLTTEAFDIVAKSKDWLLSDTGGIKWGLNILSFLLIVVLARIVAGIIAGIVRKAISSDKFNTSDLLKDFIINTVRKVVFFIGVVIALEQLEIDIGPLLAGIGVLGFVVGFALQETLGSFAAGVMILLYRPYDVGNVVTVAGETGKVNAMSLVSTTLITPDNQVLTIPNNAIWGSVIRNITANDTRRVDMVFGIGYSDDMDQAAAIIKSVVEAHEAVLKDPEPQIEVAELADSSVNFVVRPWAETGDYWAVKFDVTKTIKERFDAEGISIPFPQRDLHVFQESAS